MAENAGLDRLPQLTTKSLVKISHAMIDRDRASPKWTHVTERDGLVLALDHVRFPTASQQYAERRILRVLSGPEVVVCEAIRGAVFICGWGSSSTALKVVVLLDRHTWISMKI